MTRANPSQPVKRNQRRDYYSDFVWKDWRSDPAVRIVSLAARGLWMEMLSLMFEAEPRGYLLLNGHPISEAQLAALAGSNADDVSALMKELHDAGVFSINRKGVPYNRRMVRDEKRRKIARENGSLGGNPALKKSKPDNGAKRSSKKENPPPDNQELFREENPDDKSRARASHNHNHNNPSIVSPDAKAGGPYVFDRGLVRINQKTFDEWSKAFWAIPDLRAAIYELAVWGEGRYQPGDWFHRLSGSLAKKHQEHVANGAEKPKPKAGSVEWARAREKEREFEKKFDEFNKLEIGSPERKAAFEKLKAEMEADQAKMEKKATG